MARRKSKRKAPPKRKMTEPLEKVFTCPFCNHEKSCDVKLDRKRNTAQIRCTICSEDYQTVINYLTEAIDVYNEWIDECEKVNS